MSDTEKPSEKQPENPRRGGLIASIVGGLVLLVLLIWWLLSGPATVEWAETTVPFDPACETDCEIVGYVTPGHGGTPEPLRLNPNVDDPIAQWAGCVQTFTECMEETPDVLACVNDGSCPSACKTEFARVAENANDLDARLDAFSKVFLDEGAFCRPEEGGE
jgi:hypothetical protein